MYLTTKQQDETIARVNERYKEYRKHWDGKVYDTLFRDYRRMANGELPEKIAAALKNDLYKYNSKLIPRVIPDAIQFMKAISLNSLFNRDLIFQFTGLRQEDPLLAEDANDLVTYEFDHTNYIKVAEQLIEDALEVGICFQERIHWRDIRPVVQYKRDKFFRKRLVRNSFETIFEGPRYRRLRPEQVYLDPDIRNPADKPEHSKIMILSISEARLEKDGLYKDFADNIDEIKPGNFDPSDLKKYDQQGDHQDVDTEPKKQNEDFNFLYAESWFRLQNPKTNIPVITCIGIANPNNKPIMLRYDIDPMLTGESNLDIGRIYPRNDRMIGESVPEKIRSYMLHKYFTRNTRIDLAQLARDLTGILFAPGELSDMDTMATHRKRIIKMRASLPSDIKEIKLDTSPIIPLMNEELLVDTDIEKTLATSRLTQGQPLPRGGTATEVAIVEQNSQIMSNYPLKQMEDSIIKPAAIGSLMHSQLLMPEKFNVRILGKNRSGSWKNMKRSDILGLFDVRCFASSEIITKAIKQTLMNQFVQTWMQNPNVRIDWQGFCLEHAKMTEIPGVERYVPQISFDQVYAERENGMMMQGVPVPVVEQDNHSVHGTIHLPLLELAKETEAKAKQAGLEDQLTQAVQVVAIVQTHVDQHTQFQQIINGQLNVGAGSQSPNTETEGKLLRNINSNLNPEPGG